MKPSSPSTAWTPCPVREPMEVDGWRCSFQSGFTARRVPVAASVRRLAGRAARSLTLGFVRSIGLIG